MTAVLTVSVILFGVLSYLQLPVNDLPAVDYPVIQVQADYPGASPETMANNIATPLERQFMQINGLELVTSKSTQGHASLTLQFALDKSIDAAATDVQTAISQATGSLPVDLPSPPTFSKTNPNDQPIMYIALTSDSVTRGQLYDYASTQIGQRISILPGVSPRVASSAPSRRFASRRILRRMWARGISIDDLSAAIKSGTSYTGAGQFDAPQRHRAAAAPGPARQRRGVQQSDRRLDQRRAGLSARRRRRCATRFRTSALNMRFWARGYPVPGATVVLAVYRQAGANAVEVANSIRGLLPADQRRAARLGAHHAALRPLARHRQLGQRRAGDAGRSPSSWS